MSIYETNLDQNLANYTVLSPLSFLERSRKTFPDQIAIEYEDYKKEVDNRNSIKYGQRFVSPFVMGYGLAVVASSSLSAALLSIERNTRKKKD